MKVNSLPAIGEHLTANYYVDQAMSNSVDEPSLVRKSQENNIYNFNPTNINSSTLGTQVVFDKHVITNAYVDQLHSDNEGNKVI